jgi:hypothetical protein
MKRSLIFGLIAVLSAGLLLVACSDGSDSSGSSTVINGRLVDVALYTEESLASALLNPDYQIIGVIETFQYKTASVLSIVTEIPVGKTVVLYTPIAVGTGGLEVKGELIVDGSGELTAIAATNRVLVSSGHIVVSNGTLSVDNVAAIYSSTPGSVIENPAFNTGGIRFENGTLNITAAVDNLGNIETLFNLVPRGELVLDEVLEAINPSVLAATIKTTATRRLSITEPVGHIGAGDPVETLTIPAGMSFNTADPLSNLTSLTVLGDLTATEAKLALVTDLTVAGRLDAVQGLYTKLTALTVSGSFAPPLGINGLTALTVDGPLGNFTAPSAGGAPTGDTAGLTLTVNAGGTADIDEITNLKQGTIAGTLIAESFTALVPQGGSATTSALSASAGAIINGVPFTAETTEVIELAADAVKTGNFAVAASQILKIPANDDFANLTILTIAAGSTFTYNGQVILEATKGKLVLAGGTTPAKIVGIGTIKAGLTTITGDWEAVGADGTVTIASAAAGATITAVTATELKASAAGATIIQNADTGNAFVIGASTIINLGGTGDPAAELGVIILKNDTSADANTKNGKLTIGTGSSIITANVASTASTTAVALSQTGVSEVTTNSFSKIGVATLKGDGTTVLAKTTGTAPTATTGTAGKLVSLEGAESVSCSTATDNGPDGRISATTVTEADVTE